MVQDGRRKKSGRYVPDALTSSKRKNQTMGRTRRRRDKTLLKEAKDGQGPN